jgi:hypothetical protein
MFFLKVQFKKPAKNITKKPSQSGQVQIDLSKMALWSS